MGNSYNWVLDYLLDRSQFTTVNGSSSSTKPTNYRVPQGSLLGPGLYLIYVNDMPDAVTEGEVEMYADDTTYEAMSVKDYDNVTSFKNCLKHLSKFINNFTFEKESSLIIVAEKYQIG